MRKLFAGLGAALAVLIMALAMAPPNASAVGTGSPDSQVTLFVDHAALAGRPGGAVLTDISSYTDQLGAIALADSIDPMGSVALDTQAVGVATARSDDWLKGQQGSAPALLASSTNSLLGMASHVTNPADTFGGPMASAGIRKLGVAFVGMKHTGGTGRAIAMHADFGTTFSQYTAQGSA